MSPLPSDTEGAALLPEGLAGMGAPAPQPQAAAMDRYLHAVLRHKWLVLIVTICGTVGGIFATRLVQLRYVAQSTLWIETTRPTEVQQGPIREGQLLQSFAWLELLKSYTVLDHVVKTQRLFTTTASPEDARALRTLDIGAQFRSGEYTLTVDAAGREFVLTAGEDVVVDRGPVGGPVGVPVGLAWTPPAEELRPNRVMTFSVRNPRDVARGLGDQLQTKMAEHGNFLMLSLEGTDPQRIAATINALSERYVEVAAQLKRAKLDELTTILNEQLRYAEQNLRDAEIALESFRVQTVTLPSEQASPVAAGLQLTRDPVFTNFFDLRVRREQSRQDREAIERILRDARQSPAALDALPNIPSARGSAELLQTLELRTAKRTELRAMRQRYTDEYAPARQLIEEIRTLEERTIPQLAEAVVDQLASAEVDADRRIASASGELREIPPRAIEEARLARQVDIAEDLHTTLKQRYEVARLAAAGSIPDIRVLDAAVQPSAPISDPRPMLVLGGLFGSLGLVVLGILLVDRVDPRVRYPEQVSQDMGIPVIGIVPHLKNAKGLADDRNAGMVSEAFREIRLSVAHAHGAAGPVVFTVTSAEPGDGKSFVSSNLALAYAQQGYRTLLIDGDIRRGRLHHLLECERSPGLTDYLAGRATYDEIFQTTRIPLVTLIGSGTRMEVGPELLGSSAMNQLVRSVRPAFDVVVVDSPPLGAGVDPYILGTVTGNVLLVFRTGNTNRAFANAKLSMLDRLPIRVLGAILNDVPSHQKVYRYYSYLPGYRAENEETLLSLPGAAG